MKESQDQPISASTITDKIYPNPYLDIIHSSIPKNIKKLFKLCRSTYYWGTLIRQAIKKIAEYPVTDIIIETKEDGQRKKWEAIFNDTLKISNLHKSLGCTYFTYGNYFASVVFPIRKKLVCPICSRVRKEELREYSTNEINYKFEKFEFKGVCPKCHNQVIFKVRDEYTKNAIEVSIVSWKPEYMDIVHNELTGTNVYYYDIPPDFKKLVKVGDKDIIETVPQKWLLAIKKNQKIKMGKNFFHLKQEELADDFAGWGIPLMLNALPLDFYVRILRKAQEAIAIERIFSLRYFYPSAGVAGQPDPMRQMDLGDLKKKVDAEVKAWKKDPNRISFFPIPLGQGNFGGDARALLVTPEIMEATKQVVTAMGIPLEFIFGGVSWSGSAISMRIFENFLLTYRKGLLDFNNFIAKVLRKQCNDLKEISIGMTDFRMGDDIQRTQILVKRNTEKKVSDEIINKRFRIDTEKEREMIKKDIEHELKVKEQIAMGDAKIQAKAQAELQKQMVDQLKEISLRPGELIKGWAQQLMGMENSVRNETLGYLQKDMPMMFRQIMATLVPQTQGASKGVTEKGTKPQQEEPKVEKPLPEKKPPRRKEAAI